MNKKPLLLLAFPGLAFLAATAAGEGLPGFGSIITIPDRADVSTSRPRGQLSGR